MADKQDTRWAARPAKARRRKRRYRYPKLDARLTQELKDGVAAYCRDQKISRSQLVRRALKAVLPPIYLEHANPAEGKR